MFSESFLEVTGRVSKKNAVEQTICLILSFLCALGLLSYMVAHSDMTPATFDDYVPLNEQLLLVQDDPMIMLKSDGTIEITNDTISYTIENKECSMTGVYNKDFKLISKSQKDKCFSIFTMIMICMLFGCMGFIIIFFLLMFVVYFVWFIVLLITACIKKRKENNIIESKTEEVQVEPQGEVQVDVESELKSEVQIYEGKTADAIENGEDDEESGSSLADEGELEGYTEGMTKDEED